MVLLGQVTEVLDEVRKLCLGQLFVVDGREIEGLESVLDLGNVLLLPLLLSK